MRESGSCRLRCRMWKETWLRLRRRALMLKTIAYNLLSPLINATLVQTIKLAGSNEVLF